MSETLDPVPSYVVTGDRAYSLQFLDCEDAGPIIEAALAGNAKAEVDLWIIRRFLARCRAGPARKAPPCLACRTKLRRQRLPLIIVVAVRTGSEPLDVIVAGFCRNCGLRSGWPGPDWRARLDKIVRPVIEEAWSEHPFRMPAN
jgi:hypothetical protein